MASLLDRLLVDARLCGLEGIRVLAGVSGGADSVALLTGLHHLQGELQLEVIAGHLNHQLRGDQSQQDADWVADLCRRLSISLVNKSQDVAQLAAAAGQGIEQTARDVRYRFLDEAARKLRCTHVAVAHTADDQAETILHHIIRGTGLSGLRGMPPVRTLASGCRVVRPLLNVTRQEVETYLHEIGQEFRSDATNEDVDYTRNRIRQVLLPLIAREFNPNVGEALRRLGWQAADVVAALDALADERLALSVEYRTDDVVRLKCDVLRNSPRHLIRECLVRLWREQDWPRQAMGFAEWDRLAELVVSGGDAITLPGNIDARRRGNLLVLTVSGE